MYLEYEPGSGEKKICSDQNILKLRFFGRTDLWISRSRAKFDEQADFEAHSAVAPQNQSQNVNSSEIFAEQIFFSVEKQNIGNRLKCAFAKFCLDPIQRVLHTYPAHLL